MTPYEQARAFRDQARALRVDRVLREAGIEPKPPRRRRRKRSLQRGPIMEGQIIRRNLGYVIRIR